MVVKKFLKKKYKQIKAAGKARAKSRKHLRKIEQEAYETKYDVLAKERAKKRGRERARREVEGRGFGLNIQGLKKAGKGFMDIAGAAAENLGKESKGLEFGSPIGEPSSLGLMFDPLGTARRSKRKKKRR